MAFTVWGVGLGVAVGLFVYHLVFIVAVVLTKQILFNDYDNTSTYASQQLTTRNEIDSFVEIAILVPSLIYEQATTVVSYINQHKALILGGVLIIPVCLVVAEHPDFWIPIVDMVYNVIYDVFLFPLKLLFNLIRFVYDAGIGIYDFICRSLVGSIEAFQSTALKEVNGVLHTFLTEHGEATFAALKRVVSNSFGTVWAMLTACFTNKPAKDIVGITFATHYPALRTDLETIGAVSTVIVNVTQNICHEVANIDFVVYAIAIQRLFVDAGPGTVLHTPIYSTVIDGMEFALNIPKILFLFPFQTIPAWFGKNSAKTQAVYNGVPVPLRTAYVDMIYPAYRGLQGVGLTVDYAAHFAFRCFACYIENFLKGEINQEACMYDDGHLSITYIVYPYDGGIFYGVTSWLGFLASPLLFGLNAIGNINVMKHSLADVTASLQNDPTYDFVALQLRYDKHASVDIYPTYALASAAWYGFANTLTVVHKLDRLVNILTTNGQLVLNVALFIVDGFLSDIFGPVLDACPYSYIGSYSYNASEYFSNNWCFCINPALSDLPQDSGKTMQSALWYPNTGGASRFPFVRPMLRTHSDTQSFVCYSSLLFNATTTKTASDYDTPDVATALACPYTREPGTYPPFAFNISLLNATQSCVCHPFRDYRQPSTFCQCGRGSCGCTSPYFDSNPADAHEIMYCNFDPALYEEEQAFELDGNDVIS